MTMIAFVLSMPSNNSWNGQWTGDADVYAIVQSFKGWPTVEGKPIPERATYSFGDGWVAAIKVREVDRNEASRLRRASKGFCGYEWMVRSLLKRGAIEATP